MGPVAIELTGKAVLSFLRKIPRGRVVTYKSLGKKFKIHPRAVAKIMAGNKQPERYPCYKVVSATGSVGGYGGGVMKKIRLLRKDGIEVNKKRIDLDRFGWTIP